MTRPPAGLNLLAIVPYYYLPCKLLRLLTYRFRNLFKHLTVKSSIHILHKNVFQLVSAVKMFLRSCLQKKAQTNLINNFTAVT